MNADDQRITTDPNICHGAPTIRGLRYPVRMIVDLLESGMGADELLSDYPDLQRADLEAAAAHAHAHAQGRLTAGEGFVYT